MKLGSEIIARKENNKNKNMKEKISAKKGFISGGKIGIDGSRAYLENRTGIEEYSYKMIEYLSKNLTKNSVVLYLRKGQKDKALNDAKISFPDNWEIKEIPNKYLFTQFGLAFEMFMNQVDILFIPAHTVPFIHPQETIVTIHGLEYEHCPESYSFFGGKFHRFFIKKSCKLASKIIAVSSATKEDLSKLYKIEKNKIKVIYNGYENKSDVFDEKGENPFNWADVKNFSYFEKRTKANKFLLFIGRLELRKNILGIIETFEILKKKYEYDGKLVLAGKYGYGGDLIRKRIAESDFQRDIVCLGYVREQQKWQLIRKANVFLFPSICEGFGIPILEAQSCGIPVITSNYGPMSEVAGDENVLVDPLDSEKMANKIDKIIKEKDFRENIIKKGKGNIKRFSWEKSGRETMKLFL